MWNSGITFKHLSPGRSRRVAAMLRADAARFAWLSGTILGREVVPEVCRMSAVAPAERACAPVSGASTRRTAPDCRPSARRSAGTPWATATSIAGLAAPSATTSALAFKSSR